MKTDRVSRTFICDYEFFSRRSPNGRYILFRELPQVYVSGKTREQAISLAVGALKVWHEAVARVN